MSGKSATRKILKEKEIEKNHSYQCWMYVCDVLSAMRATKYVFVTWAWDGQYIQYGKYSFNESRDTLSDPS